MVMVQLELWASLSNNSLSHRNPLSTKSCARTSQRSTKWQADKPLLLPCHHHRCMVSLSSSQLLSNSNSTNRCTRNPLRAASNLSQSSRSLSSLNMDSPTDNPSPASCRTCLLSKASILRLHSSSSNNNSHSTVNLTCVCLFLYISEFNLQDAADP